MPEPRDGPTDEEILARLRAGESEWFGTFIRRHERELYGYLRRYLGRDDLAEDVFQATFVQVFRKIAQYEPGRAAKPWLYTIATHQAIDALRRRARRPDRGGQEPISGPDDPDATITPLDLLPAETVDPFESVINDEVRSQVRDAVNQLPEPFRQVVLLAYFQGMKLQEVGDVLGIPLGTVKSRMHAATAKLLDLLSERNEDSA